MRDVIVLRIDPDRRTIATMRLKPVKDPTPQIRRLTRSNNLGQRQVMEVGGLPLMVIAGRDVDESMQGWRLRGTEDTGGVSLLTGRNRLTGALIDAPVSREWLLERIVWLDGEDVEGRDARADELLPVLAPDVVEALRGALVAPDGDIFITAAAREIVGTALVTLGLATERSNGQLLTKLGETVHDKIVFGASLATADAAA